MLKCWVFRQNIVVVVVVVVVCLTRDGVIVMTRWGGSGWCWMIRNDGHVSRYRGERLGWTLRGW